MNAIVVTWIGIGVVILLNIIGWLIAYNRYSKNEAKHLGTLIGTVEGLDKRVESLQERISNLERRLDRFLNNWPGCVSEDD